EGEEAVPSVGRTLYLGQPVAVGGAPGDAILGQPVTQPGSALPPGRVGSLSPEFACRGRDRVGRRARSRAYASMEHAFYCRINLGLVKPAQRPHVAAT